MAKYEITRSCGHTETVQIGGPVNNRERLAERESERLCADCYRAKVAAERAAESERAAAAAKATGLPELTGSEKQIAWAESIRAKAAETLGALRPMLEAAPAANRAAAEIALAIISETMGRAGAHDWIETRNVVYDRAWLAAETKRRMGM